MPAEGGKNQDYDLFAAAGTPWAVKCLRAVKDSSILPIREPFGVVSGKTAAIVRDVAFGLEFSGCFTLFARCAWCR